MAMAPISGLKQQLKQIAFLRYIVRKTRPIYREAVFTMNAIRSGRVFVYQRNHALSHQLRTQKIIAYRLDLPPFHDARSLMDWLDNNSVRYKTGAFCIYIPPHPEMRSLFGPILSAYPPNAGLKILKDLKSPAQAKYISKAVAPAISKTADWISYRPMDFLRVANYMCDAGVGPRIYDLVEIQTPHNNFSAYVVQHVVGSVPTVDECETFLSRLDQPSEDQLVPLLPGWKAHIDFRCPDCNGNLIRNEHTGKVLYIDFQAFMMRDINRHLLQITDKIRQDVHFGNTHRLRGGQYLYQSIPGLRAGKRDVDFRWNLFKQLLTKQGVSLEKSVIFDVGCNAGMMIYSALIDGAIWAVGWDKPTVAAGARKLLLSLGLTRFDIMSQDISSDTDFLSSLPENVKSSPNPILFFLAMRKHIGFPDNLKHLPFKSMVYEDHEGESLSDVKHHLKQIVDGWGLRIADMTSYTDGDSTRKRVVAILCRE